MFGDDVSIGSQVDIADRNMVVPDSRVQFDLIVPVLYSFRDPDGIGQLFNPAIIAVFSNDAAVVRVDCRRLDMTLPGEKHKDFLRSWLVS